MLHICQEIIISSYYNDNNVIFSDLKTRKILRKKYAIFVAASIIALRDYYYYLHYNSYYISNDIRTMILCIRV